MQILSSQKLPTLQRLNILVFPELSQAFLKYAGRGAWHLERIFFIMKMMSCLGDILANWRKLEPPKWLLILMDTCKKGTKLYYFSTWAFFSNIDKLLMEIWLTLNFKKVEKVWGFFGVVCSFVWCFVLVVFFIFWNEKYCYLPPRNFTSCWKLLENTHVEEDRGGFYPEWWKP